MMVKPKACPNCNKRMIRVVALQQKLVCRMPPAQDMDWWCGCGHREPAGTERVKDVMAERLQQWEALNRED